MQLGVAGEVSLDGAERVGRCKRLCWRCASHSWRAGNKARRSRLRVGRGAAAGGPPRQSAQGSRIQRIRFGQLPVAFAKSRAWRGLTTTTGRAVAASAATTARWYPPVASRTMSVGWAAWSCATREAILASSLGTASGPPWGAGRYRVGLWPHQYQQRPGSPTYTTPPGPTLQIGLDGTRQLYGLGESTVTTRLSRGLND